MKPIRDTLASFWRKVTGKPVKEASVPVNTGSIPPRATEPLPQVVTPAVPPAPGGGIGPAASVTVAPTSASVVVGSTQQLVATVRDASSNIIVGATVTWASSDASKATVSSTGLVTAVAVGSATITAASGGINSSPVAITVTVSVASGAVPTYNAATDTLLYNDGMQYATNAALSTAGVPWGNGGGTMDAAASADPTYPKGVRFDLVSRQPQLPANGGSWDCGSDDYYGLTRTFGGELSNVAVSGSGGYDFYLSHRMKMPTGFIWDGYEPVNMSPRCDRWLEHKRLLIFRENQQSTGRMTISASLGAYVTVAGNAVDGVDYDSNKTNWRITIAVVDGSSLPLMGGLGATYLSHLNNQLKGVDKSPYACADGLEHTQTMRFRNESVANAGDGIFQMWIDGYLVFDLNGMDAANPYGLYHQVFTRKLGWDYIELYGIINGGACATQSEWLLGPVRAWKVPSTTQPTVTAVSRQVVSAAGGSTVVVTGTNFGSGTTATLGGTSCTVASYTSTTLTLTTPAKARGTYDLIVANGTLNTTLTSAIDVLQSATNVWATADFENGTLGSWSNDGTNAAASTDTAKNGTKSCKMTASGVGNSYLVKSYGNNPARASTYGVLTRYWLRLPSSTITNVNNAGTSGQIKLHLYRDFPVGANAADKHGIVLGIGPQFRGNQLAAFMDWNNVPLSGTKVGGGSFTDGDTNLIFVADVWNEVLIEQSNNGTTGRVRLWLNGKRCIDQSDVTIVGGTSGGAPATDGYSTEIGIAYTENGTGTLTVYIDDAWTADGVPTGVTL